MNYEDSGKKHATALFLAEVFFTTVLRVSVDACRLNAFLHRDRLFFTGARATPRVTFRTKSRELLIA